MLAHTSCWCRFASREAAGMGATIGDNLTRPAMRVSLVAKLRELLVVEPRHDIGNDSGRSSYERFAIPHTFKPQLSLVEAAISAAGAFLRILFGSTLFAVWGTYTFYAWNSIHNVLLRGGALLALLLVFTISFTFFMVAISSLVRKCLARCPRP